MTQSGDVQPQASPAVDADSKGQPPTVPPAEGVAVPRPLDAQLVSQPADESRITPEQDDQSEGAKASTGELRSVGEFPAKNASKVSSQGVPSAKIEATGSQQTDARRRLELLIARESATLTTPAELEESATSEAKRLLPADETRTLSESTSGTGTASQYPAAPPLPMTLEELESADQKAAKKDENSESSTSEAESRAPEFSVEIEETTAADPAVRTYTLQPQPFFPEAGAPIASHPASKSPATKALPTTGTPAESLANSAEAALQPIGTVPAQSAPARLEPARSQQPALQAQPKPGHVRIRRYAPGAVDRMFYGW